MKKWLKLGIAAMSMAVLAGSIYNANVNAANQVKVVINDWQNTCGNLEDFTWSLNASSSAQALSGQTHDLHCSLLKSNAWNVTIALSNLSWANSHVISNWAFDVSFGQTTNAWTLSVRNAVSGTAFSSAKTFYQKQQYQVWELTGSVVIKGTVPAWQEVDTYIGQLNITVPVS